MAVPAHAAASAWAEGDQASLRLVSAADAVGSEAALAMGLQVRLKPTWKIYWRSPGDAGLPPEIDWSGSGNVASAAFRWPVPHRFTLFGLDTFGYEGEVVLPLTVRLAKPGEAADLKAHVRYLVCDPQICVPAEAQLSLALPAGPAAPAIEADLIQRFVAEVPGDGSEDGLRLGRVATGRVRDAAGLIVEAQATPPFAAPDLIVEGPSSLRFSAPVVSLSDGGRRARFEIAAEAVEKDAPELAGLPLTLTLYDGKRALEAAVRPDAAASGPALPSILALALLGGFILNFMPCVLPVLALKLLGVVGQGGRERAAIRVSFLASAAGILFSFLILAAALIALKSAGAAIGWGIQFQQPIFLAGLAVVLVLFAANLFGLFHVPLPAWLGGAATPGRGHGHSLAGAFAAGAFATLLATPCSAPFLGTAVGFALARGAPEILMIFTALGLGLAAPWLLVAAFPRLAQALPRPGRWMLWLKGALGVALLAAAVWLVSVLDLQIGRAAAFAVALLLAGTLLALALPRVLPRRWHGAAPAMVAVLALAAIVVPALVPVVAAAPEAEAEAAGPWRSFAEREIAGLVAAGNLVFVDVTADWCLTCQANKRLVLNSEQIQGLLGAPDLVAMRADWTRPDPAIAAYLAAFGRYGIPFDAVYGPGAPDGIVLPELLTKDAVRHALRKAGGA
ncbi:MAG TPA: protein-disulfide reductase DsbD domain-containing protein [Methylomirabilota bacterium]|jgi:suppressor for copper-sensitivity B|nr:protein-disulfide reductase DsbD domain-containing protein [Methylomirabilota bacterium]